MATTKVRKKTPMKNKPCLWRRMSKKTYDGSTEIRHGRALKVALAGTNRPGFLLPIHIWLFRAGGIATPVFDSAFSLNDNVKESENNAADEYICDVTEEV